MINKTFISTNPRISIKTTQSPTTIMSRKLYYTIDLDMYTTSYNINEDGQKIINDYIEKNVKPYIYNKQRNNRYRYRHQTVNRIFVRIVVVDSEQVAREFANFLLKVVTDKKYITKMCESWSDIEKEFFNDVWQELNTSNNIAANV